MDDLGGRATGAKRKRGSRGPAYEAAVKLLKAVMKLKIAGDFLRPVDYKALGLFDYPQIIATPMDLGTVLNKLQDGQYDSATQMKQDVELIFANCAKYNGPDHPISVNGFQILDNFNKKFAELKAYQFETYELDAPRAGAAKVGKTGTPVQKKTRPVAAPAAVPQAADFTFEEKRLLCIRINNLDQKYLPQVIHIIHKYAPNLLDTDASQAGGVEEVEISVDNLQAGVLRELDTLVKQISSPNSGLPPAVVAQPPVQHFQSPAPQASVTTTTQVPAPVQQQPVPQQPYYPPQNYAAPQNHAPAETPMDISHPTEVAAAPAGDSTDAFMSIQ